MEREIKFKGKDPTTGRWVKGDLCKNGAIIKITGKNIMDVCVVDPSTVGRFTGFKDKNGCDIYEGDILRCNWGIKKQYNPMQLDKDINVAATKIQRCEVYYSKHYDNFAMTVDMKTSTLIKFKYTMVLTEYRCKTFCRVVGNVHDQKVN